MLILAKATWTDINLESTSNINIFVETQSSEDFATELICKSWRWLIEIYPTAKTNKKNHPKLWQRLIEIHTTAETSNKTHQQSLDAAPVD